MLDTESSPSLITHYDNHLDSEDSKEAESAAYRITSQAFRKLKRDRKAEQNPDQVETQSLVAELKKGSDSIAPFHIYYINSKKMNNLPDFVMKSSSKILQIAIDMDIDGPENPLQLEDAYFNSSHSRYTDCVVRTLGFACRNETDDTTSFNGS